MPVDHQRVATRFIHQGGANIYMQECLTDARVVLLRLKKLIGRATALVESSPARSHIYERAGDIVYNIPQVVGDLEKALLGAALAADKIDAAEIERFLPQRDVKELKEMMEKVPGLKSALDASSVLPGDLSGGGVPAESQDSEMFGYKTFGPTAPRGYEEDFGGSGGGKDDTDNPSFSRDEGSEPAKNRQRQDVRTVYYDGVLDDEDDDEADGRTKSRYPYKLRYKPTKNAHEVLVAFVERCQMEWEHHHRIALTLDQLLGLPIDPALVDRAAGYRPRLSRVMKSRNLWHFAVGDYVVRVRAVPKTARVKKLTAADIRLSCSCNAWRWQGPEYHAKKQGYLEGKPRGTASTPDIRDPERVKPLCKHALATVQFLQQRDYSVAPVRRSGRR